MQPPTSGFFPQCAPAPAPAPPPPPPAPPTPPESQRQRRLVKEEKKKQAQKHHLKVAATKDGKEAAELEATDYSLFEDDQLEWLKNYREKVIAIGDAGRLPPGLEALFTAEAAGHSGCA